MDRDKYLLHKHELLHRSDSISRPCHPGEVNLKFIQVGRHLLARNDRVLVSKTIHKTGHCIKFVGVLIQIYTIQNKTTARKRVAAQNLAIVWRFVGGEFRTYRVRQKDIFPAPLVY